MTSPSESERKPHAALDVDSRRLKAVKIERLLNLKSSDGAIRMLEIGTGSGAIAHYFATHPDLNLRVSAVDVVDQRLLRDTYEFRLVKDTRLPFEQGAFDVVVNNHVIEHVGDRNDQLAHLNEIRRVMSKGAVGYLATPNRWTLVEPHFRLAFLSWLPRTLRDRYLRLWRRGDRYDCEPLSLRNLHRLFEEAGFEYLHIEGEALRVANELERRLSALQSLVQRLAVSVLGHGTSVSPTFVCLLSTSGPVDAQ